jgi:hypothetical protein
MSYIKYLADTAKRRLAPWERKLDAEMTAANAGAALRKSLDSIKASGESSTSRARRPPKVCCNATSICRSVSATTTPPK